MDKTELRLDELKRIMRECGAEDAAGLDGDVLDVPFKELGLDSLAVMEIGARVERDYGVEMPDDVMDKLQTPRETLDFVNHRLPAA
ncbi:acyl carrier protein [Nonomuraea sp. PA05]|uniref:acyl carrier protein n=1 Tax=Nonomuraea sp. PA05 TaxID=2604466 RepID=UPI0011D5EB76|nr:acyl carrier protein [Nonomuraea sp. PA05]TYB60582.1 acyl carrier protein [Nonomuraea sp. PA05]